jgi:hypothetical protein
VLFRHAHAIRLHAENWGGRYQDGMIERHFCRKQLRNQSTHGVANRNPQCWEFLKNTSGISYIIFDASML